MKIGDVFFEKHTIVKMSSRDPEQWAEADVEEVDAIEIPDNATNGEVIRALFPQAEVKECYKDIDGKPHLYRVYKLDIYPTEFTEEFWNAPYKKGENK